MTTVQGIQHLPFVNFVCHSLQMRIANEIEILDQGTRKKIIEEIMGTENQSRKRESYKRYLSYKDKTKDFVVEQLLKQFDQSTVNEMAYCISNISFVRKIIDKLARVYNHGVDRDVEGDEQSAENIEKLTKELDFNTCIRNANKFLKLQKNLAFYVKPCPVTYIDGSEKYTIKLEPMNPYLYDVVEDMYDRTRPIAYVLSDFDYSPTMYSAIDAATAGRTNVNLKAVDANANNKDETIADSPSDAKTCEIIWWSDNYHFTTDIKGNIISESIENPIKELPFENFAIEQDGQFWAQGGDDLIDGNILINSILTHNQHVAVTQGYGQFWMSGKNIPTHLKIGPTKMVRMEYQEGEPVPAIGFANASPQIDSLRGLVESYIALLLTTNNLSTSSVAASLNGSNSAPSGIAMVIDKSESMEDVNDQRQIFIDKEPNIWRKINKWLNVYGDNLVDNLKGLELKEGFDKNFSLNFLTAPVISSEQEKLQNLKLRKELGIDSMIDLIMMDNPQLTEQQAEDKLKKIMEDSILKSMSDHSNSDSSKQEQPIDPNAPDKKPEDNVVDLKAPQPTADINVQKTALNGAQVTSMVDVVSKVSLGLIPRDAGIQILFQAFNIAEEEAQRLMGDAGAGFTPDTQGAPSGSNQDGIQSNQNSKPDQLQK